MFHLINIYNKKIVSGAEVNALYLTLKQFSLLIINSDSEADFVNNIPRYLFREKFFLLDLFKKYNSYKKKSLVDLLFKAEKSLRKESGLSVSVGLRILLGFKKITIS